MDTTAETMSLNQILAILRQVKPVIQSRYNTRIIGVFGSFARGKQKPGSDLDILVEFGEGSSLSTVGGVLNYLEDRLGLKVDIADEPSIRPGYKPFIYKDLIRL